MANDAPGKRPVFVYLSEILAEIEFLKAAAAGLTFEQYLKSGEKRRAVERSLEIISEATRGIPETDQALHPDIPWRRVQDLGNVIRHAYFGLAQERLWAIIQTQLDKLEQAVRQLQSRHPSR
ncbi:MAG: DUF86 domain-containing protein [Xanthobacteraceae bacterium]|nr:DUF86 domain-containing protein [Xanthobacteraceae bacterium]